MPLTPYLQALGLEKDELVQALGISFTVCTLALASRLAGATIASATLSWMGVASLCASIGGLWAGTAIRRRINQVHFRQVMFAAFALLGALTAWGV